MSQAGRHLTMLIPERNWGICSREKSSSRESCADHGTAQPGAAHQGELQTEGSGQSSGFSSPCCALMSRAAMKSSSRCNSCCSAPTTRIRPLCILKKKSIPVSCYLVRAPDIWSWLGADLLCGSLRFGTGDAQWDAQLALEMQLGQHSAMGRCCSDSGAAALSLELHTGAWGWLGVQELLSPSFGKPWKRGGCFGKIEVWSSAQ